MDVNHVIDKALAVSEATQRNYLPTVGTLTPPLLHPPFETVIAGEFPTLGTHPSLAYFLQADEALENIMVFLHLNKLLLQPPN